jgi:hypothetical protein
VPLSAHTELKFDCILTELVNGLEAKTIDVFVILI